MRSTAIIGLLVLLMVPCIAVPDSVMTGPYKISFDINGTPSTDYTVIINDPEKTEALDGTQKTTYSVEIDNNLDSTQKMLIYISTSTKENVDATDNVKELAVRYVLDEISGTDNIETASRTIDNTKGTVASCDIGSKKAYSVIYYPTIDKKHTVVTMISTYPWDEGTLSLLKTIHL